MKNLFTLAGLFLLIIPVLVSADEAEPMFGNQDRNTDPNLSQQDAAFIAKATNTFGTREHASIGYVDSGFEAHLKNKDQLAMQRFNEAWLLNPENPYVYVGFSVLYQKQQQYCAAMDMFQQAAEKELDEAGFLADFAFAITQCATTKDAEIRAKLLGRADQHYREAELTPNPRVRAYVYQSWAKAGLLQNDVELAQNMVDKANALGNEVSADLIEAINKARKSP